MEDLISVLNPHEDVFKQSDVAEREGKYKRFRISDIKVGKKQGLKLLKRFKERTLPLREMDLEVELRQLVQRYCNRLRQEVPDIFGRNAAPLQKFEEIAKELLHNNPASFSFITTKTPDCFVALVRKNVDEESREIIDMIIYFLKDAVRVRNAGGAVHGGEEEGAVGGAAEEQRREPIATLILPREWRNSFQKSLENNIHLCHGHIDPALEALRLGHNSYTDSDGKTCNFNSTRGDRQFVQGKKIFKSKISYKLQGKNPHGTSHLCKVHLNGDGSDCNLVYVAQTYMQEGQAFRVFLLVGVFTHYECGIRTGARKKQRGTQKGENRNTLDITEDMEAAEEYLEEGEEVEN